MTDPLAALVEEHDGRAARALQVYEALVQTGKLHSSRVRCMTYRCASHGCTVLDVFEVPGEGVVVGVPRYKTSRKTTEETSSGSGRQANTEDGERRWRRHATFWDGFDRSLACDHLNQVTVSAGVLMADWEARRTEVRVRPDGSAMR